MKAADRLYLAALAATLSLLAFFSLLGWALSGGFGS